MTKVALLIGVSEYGFGLSPLPGAERDIEAMQQVLQPSEIGGFDQVKLLSNPNPPVMREAIEKLFSDRTHNDLILLFFSGHIIQDDSGQLYLATSVTCKSPRTELIRVSAIPVSFVQNLINNSICQRHVVILDCCFSSILTPETTANNHEIVDIETQLGGTKQIILTSVIASDNSLVLESAEHSIYTRYLVEGIGTGAADLDNDGGITIDELHEYASQKVQIVSPAVKPELYSIADGRKILLANVPVDHPKLKYRQQAESWASYEGISQAGRYILDNLAQSLQLTPEDCNVIEAEVLRPYQEYQEKLQRYKREFAQALSKKSPLGTQECEELKSIQQSLGLRDEDVAPIEEQLVWKLAAISKVETDEIEQEADNSDLLGSQEEQKSIFSTPNTVLPKKLPIPPPIEDINSTNAVNLSTNLAEAQTNSPASSAFPNKLLLAIGIAGTLTIAAVAVGIFTRTPKAVSPTPATTATIANSNHQPSSNPSASLSPVSKSCTIFVNGNLRSEPTFYWDNVVESLREPLPVTGKQTKEGWIEVKMPNNKLAWVHVDIISNKDRKEMDTCLASKGITIKTIEDIPPPAVNSFP